MKIYGEITEFLQNNVWDFSQLTMWNSFKFAPISVPNSLYCTFHLFLNAL